MSNEVYHYEMESVKQFLFADEFGLVDDEGGMKTEDLKLVFSHFISPMLTNLEKGVNIY